VDQQVDRLSLLDRLSAMRGLLSPSEMRVADIVLEDPKAVPRKNLAALAAGAGVSEPTVLRFCRSLGLDGYAHFKIALAEALAAGGAAYVHREIGFDDTVAMVRSKVFQSSIGALAAVRDSLDDSIIEKAVERIRNARRLALLGVGLAHVVAADAQQKLMRLNITCEALPDTHMQTMSAATLTSEDVAIAFSYNGRVKDIVRAARAARDAGAFVIAVTRADSPLAREVDLLIPVDTPEDTFLYAPMTTRLAHFAIVDLLATLVALSRGPAIVERLEHIKESLSDQWIAESAPTRRRTRLAASG
jgi:RpiR family carbohydrate utilization transcriptional regulator